MKHARWPNIVKKVKAVCYVKKKKIKKNIRYKPIWRKEKKTSDFQEIVRSPRVLNTCKLSPVELNEIELCDVLGCFHTCEFLSNSLLTLMHPFTNV